MWNINAPQGRIPSAIFTKFAEFVLPFQGVLAVKIWLEFLEGLWSYGGFKLMGCGYPPNFQRPLAVKLCVRPQKL